MIMDVMEMQGAAFSRYSITIIFDIDKHFQSITAGGPQDQKHPSQIVEGLSWWLFEGP